MTARKPMHLKEKAGRKSLYTPDLAKRVCDKIACENKSLGLLSKENEWFPSDETILLWRIDFPEFSGMYLEAKKIQAQLGDESLKKLSESLMEYTYIDKEGNKKIDPGAIAACALISTNIKWASARLAKGLYSESVEQNIKVSRYDDIIKEIHSKIEN